MPRPVNMQIKRYQSQTISKVDLPSGLSTCKVKLQATPDRMIVLGCYLTIVTQTEVTGNTAKITGVVQATNNVALLDAVELMGPVGPRESSNVYSSAIGGLRMAEIEVQINAFDASEPDPGPGNFDEVQSLGVRAIILYCEP